MGKIRLRIPGPALLGLLGFTILLAGCAAPIEFKNASKTQLELIDSVDGAVADLQAALDQFHRDMEAGILEEGHMLIARQAIDVAVSNDDSEVSADSLFEIYIKQIQPWVDYAFNLTIIDSQIVTLKKRIEATQDTVLKVALIFDLEDLELLKARLQNKPQRIEKLETIIQNNLDNERKTARQNHQNLDILRAQVALMKAMQEKVDAWLALDVTVTQEQADALKEAFNSANQALKGGGQ